MTHIVPLNRSVKRYSQFCPGFLKTAFTYFVDEVNSFEDVMTTTQAKDVILRMNNPAIPEIDRYKGVINAKLKKNKLKWKRGETARKFFREPIKRYMHLLPELLSCRQVCAQLETYTR